MDATHKRTPFLVQNVRPTGLGETPPIERSNTVIFQQSIAFMSWNLEAWECETPWWDFCFFGTKSYSASLAHITKFNRHKKYNDSIEDDMKTHHQRDFILDKYWN